MSLSRKRKKELRKLQNQANKLWAHQQSLAGDAADVAREAGRQLDNFRREQVVPQVQDKYEKYAAPYVDKSVKATKHLVDDAIVPAAGAVVGSAMSVWDAASVRRAKAALRRNPIIDVPQKKGPGAGGVIAIILGVAAAVGVVYAAWQTLRADDELWVADDPLRAPDA